MAWLLESGRTGCVFQELLISWDFHTQQNVVSRMVPKQKNCLLAEMACCWERSKETGQSGLNWQDGYRNSREQSLGCCPEKHLWTHNVAHLWNLGADSKPTYTFTQTGQVENWRKNRLGFYNLVREHVYRCDAKWIWSCSISVVLKLGTKIKS